MQSARNVIGVELCSDAVEDAKTNARINGEHFWLAVWQLLLTCSCVMWLSLLVHWHIQEGVDGGQIPHD